jgi:hypothetical protein
LIGRWYGHGYQKAYQEDHEYTVDLAVDGRFAIHFRAYKGCRITHDKREAGTWSRLDANTLRVTITSVDGVDDDPWVTDYRILELTRERHRYVSERTGSEYTDWRVDANFTLPECGLTS